MEIVLPFGVVEGDEKVEIDDNVISNYVVKQEARSARVTVHFAAQGQKWKTIEQAQPRRLFVDVYALGVDPEPEAPVASSQESGAKSLALAASASSAAAKGHESSIPKKRKIIVIDAGHGGKDPGAIGLRGVREKDINLAAALELSRVLNARGDFQVVLTRENDSFVPLSDRSKIANDLNADLFVSLHCNSSLNHRESGFEVYSVSETASDPEAERLAATENAALELEGKKPEEEAAKQILLAMTKTEMINESAPFAALVQRSLGKRISVADRGAKQAGFYVLRGTHAPAILVEMAFVSHVKDEAMLGSARFRRKMAEGIAAGIAEYARKKGWLE
jgi:N-acetylmuramoyl-L-alanine amidase